MQAPSAGLKIRELGHVSLFVRDLEATRRFYRDLLGLAETGTAKGGRIVF
ncbi:MAG: VOC family protein, partial [candidate division NC10 bacterium]